MGKITNQELDTTLVTKLSNSDSHIANTSNPHGVTASQVGAEPANANIQTHISSTSNPHAVTATQIGLGNVTNESKATMFTSPTFTGTVDLTGGQIKFPATQVPSADANTLDDYEEGTFTPVFTNFTVGNGGVFGYYTKIGKIVTITYGFNFGSTSAITGSITGMSGLPFVIGAGGPIGGFFSACGHALDNASNFYDLIVIFPAGSTITYDIRRSGTITDISTTYPFTWTNGDALGIICTYLTT